MAGDATVSGTTYQAGVVAFVYVHMLLEQRLGWFELFDDEPVAVEGEVNGPGDDVRVDFHSRLRQRRLKQSTAWSVWRHSPAYSRAFGSFRKAPLVVGPLFLLSIAPHRSGFTRRWQTIRTRYRRRHRRTSSTDISTTLDGFSPVQSSSDIHSYWRSAQLC